MNPVAFITANYVARPLGYRMTRGWMQGDSATNDLFRPVETFAERFDDLLAGVKALGFAHIDLWCAHLHPAWATLRHLEIAREVLARHGLTVTTVASHWGRTAEDLRLLARVLRALDCRIISGGHGLLKDDRALLVGLLREHRLQLAYENHAERSAAEILAAVGEGDADVLGVAFDTGWAGTRGFAARDAVRELGGRLLHLHAKDVKARRAAPTGLPFVDLGHETCALGDGIVSIEAVIKEAVRGGFAGPIGIEHEPEDHDPDPEVRTSLARVQHWLREVAGPRATARGARAREGV
ncbi:MAG TPA: sugar phosphate isomerase/epimerase [Opitutaceae bacterium]|nr:sugar phosphate isomerase/epimerase [Opitutaceae bacterium]